MSALDISSTASTQVVTAFDSHPTAPKLAIDSCVNYVMLKSDLGDAFWSQHWENLSQDESALRAWCAEYATDNPSEPPRMLDEYLAIKRYLKATTATTTTATPPTTALQRATSTSSMRALG